MERSPPPAEAASELPFRDDLTGAWNRRYLRRLLTDDWAELTRRHGTFTLLVLDLDGFKPVNDRFGHAAGDRVLRWAADELRRGFREGDRLIRYGGDEFVVALPGVGAEEARVLAERARAGFDAVEVEQGPDGTKASVPISFSLGVASFPEDGTDGEQLLAVADQRLYEEKRERRPAVRSAAGRWRWVAVSLVALAALALAVTSTIREWKRAPEPPAAIAPAPADTAGSMANEIVVRDEEELGELRREVERLRAALASERADQDRAAVDARIVELEEQLARADREAAVTPLPPPASDVEAATGMRVGERRTREELSAEGGAPPAVATAAGNELAPANDLLASGLVEESVSAPPRLLRAPRVRYPPLARNRRREATVELRLTVDATGRVIAAVPVGPPAGFGLDEAARAAGLSASFAPGTRDGVPVEMETTLAIRFQLEEARER